MSKQCPNCNNILPDDAFYCNVCGVQFSGGQQRGGYQQNSQYQQSAQYQQGNDYQGNPYQQQSQYQGEAYSTSSGKDVDMSILVDSGENVVTSLSGSPLINFLASGGLAKTEMFFTERRFYVRRKEFSLWRGITTQNDIVDLADVTGTKLIQTLPILFFVIASLALILSLILTALSGDAGYLVTGILGAGLWVLCFFLLRGVRIIVFFPGGSSSLHFRNCNYQPAANFHRQLRMYVEANKR